MLDIEKILKEQKMELTSEHYRAMIFYGYKVEINQEKFLQHLQLVYSNEAPFDSTEFRWCTEFRTRNLF